MRYFILTILISMASTSSFSANSVGKIIDTQKLIESHINNFENYCSKPEQENKCLKETIVNENGETVTIIRIRSSKSNSVNTEVGSQSTAGSVRININ